MSDQQQLAAFYIGLFNQFADRLEELDCKRYNKEFLEAYGVQNPTAPIVLMFDAFVAGIDMGGKSLLSCMSWTKKKPLPNGKGSSIAEAIPAW